MVNEDIESVSLPALRMQVSLLQRDFYRHSEVVNESLKKIFDFISEEVGARRERENSFAVVSQKSELTWTKTMAIAGLVGAFQVAPSIFHSFFR
jgi:hypothetical protein